MRILVEYAEGWWYATARDEFGAVATAGPCGSRDEAIDEVKAKARETCETEPDFEIYDLGDY